MKDYIAMKGYNMQKVFIETSENYRFDRVLNSVEKIFEKMGGIQKFIKPGMLVAIKPNLVTAKKPEDAATTHPMVVKAVTVLVQNAGGIVTIVESPGGPYNTSSLKRVYEITGMEDVANSTGAQLNFDLRVEKKDNPEAELIKSLKVLKPLKDAELIINIAKLKTHGMMVYTGAVKNMFGSIAGLEKADYHLRMSDYDRFADSLIDIYLATKPCINLIDGIIAMEGDGPNSGVPKSLGVLLASENAFACDYAALQIIGVDHKLVPVLKIAEKRGLFDVEKVCIEGIDINLVKPDDFDVPAVNALKSSPLLRIFNFVGKGFRPKPEINNELCKLCGKCIEVCPPHAISRSPEKTMLIDYSKCISCFCCHEFCPEKAVKIKRNVISKLFEYKRL